MRGILLAMLVMFCPAAVWANDWDALKQPGAVALMRHALAPGVGDPNTFRLDDCATQRNLNGQGRAQARRIGAALRERDIAFAKIWTSGWCRAVETATLMDMGPVEVWPALHSFFAGRGSRSGQTQDVLATLAARADDKPLLLVTHQVNITALTGQTLASGEMIIVQRRADGSLEVSVRVNIAP